MFTVPVPVAAGEAFTGGAVGDPVSAVGAPVGVGAGVVVLEADAAAVCEWSSFGRRSQ